MSGQVTRDWAGQAARSSHVRNAPLGIIWSLCSSKTCCANVLVIKTLFRFCSDKVS